MTIVRVYVVRCQLYMLYLWSQGLMCVSICSISCEGDVFDLIKDNLLIHWQPLRAYTVLTAGGNWWTLCGSGLL